ncbi:head GIN domain-containing protein [Flavitalea sp.]|nr:head GIN domain-containing protein [Flavitalea sp.]
MRKFLLFLLSVVVLSSCRFGGGKRVEGNGNIKSEERSVGSFSVVEVHGAIDVHVSQGDLKPVRIEGDENLLEYIEIKQNGNKIEVRSRRGYNLRPTSDLKIYVTSPNFSEIGVSGACDIIGETKISNNDKLSLHVSGAGDIKMEVDVPVVTTDISGSGSVNLKGKTRDFSCELSGAGHARCFDLLTENTTIEISGAGDAEVYASMKVDAQVSGAGSVKYKGEAATVNQKVSGAGSVRKVD